jgi:hypothetical protein
VELAEVALLPEVLLVLDEQAAPTTTITKAHVPDNSLFRR